MEPCTARLRVRVVPGAHRDRAPDGTARRAEGARHSAARARRRTTPSRACSHRASAVPRATCPSSPATARDKVVELAGVEPSEVERRLASAGLRRLGDDRRRAVPGRPGAALAHAAHDRKPRHRTSVTDEIGGDELVERRQPSRRPRPARRCDRELDEGLEENAARTSCGRSRRRWPGSNRASTAPARVRRDSRRAARGRPVDDALHPRQREEAAVSRSQPHGAADEPPRNRVGSARPHALRPVLAGERRLGAGPAPVAWPAASHYPGAAVGADQLTKQVVAQTLSLGEEVEIAGPSRSTTCTTRGSPSGSSRARRRS